MASIDFEALNEHLQEIRPIFDKFCTDNRFFYVNQQSLGRYPRIRIERKGEINVWFDLWMELNSAGRRFECFSRDLPYELSAGAYFDVQDGSKYGHRFQKAFCCFSNVPFEQIKSRLLFDMQKHLRTLAEWNANYLEENGERVQLGI